MVQYVVSDGTGYVFLQRSYTPQLNYNLSKVDKSHCMDGAEYVGIVEANHASLYEPFIHPNYLNIYPTEAQALDSLFGT